LTFSIPFFRRVGRPAAILSFTVLGLLWQAGGLLAEDARKDPTTPDAQSTEDAAPRVASNLTVKLLQSKLEEAENSSTLDETARQQLVELYRAAQTNLEELQAYNTEADAYRTILKTGPAEIAELRSKTEAATAALDKDPPVELAKDATEQEVQRLLTQDQAELASVETVLAELEKVIDAADQEPTDARRQLAETKQALDQIDSELAQPLPEGLSETQSQAQRWVQESRRDALRAQVLMLDQKILSSAVRAERATVRREQGQAEIKRLKRRIAYLQERADQLRRKAAEQVQAETRAAEQEARDAHPLVQAMATENAALSEGITKLTDQLGQMHERQDEVEASRARIAENFRSARLRLEAATVSHALGQVLLDERGQLPDLERYRRTIEQQGKAISRLTLDQIRHREELRQLGDTDTYIDTRLAVLEQQDGAPLSAEARSTLRKDLATQVKRRVELLQRLIDVTDNLLRAMNELDFANRQLIEVASKYDGFLAENLLWVRNMVPITQQPLMPLPRSILWLASPDNWIGVGKVLLHEAISAPVLWAGLLVILVLLWRGRRLRRAIRATADPLRRISTDRFSYTLTAIGLTLLLAAPWPLLTALIGWRLDTSAAATTFSRNLGVGLISIAIAFYYLRAFKLICMAGGVADRHFRWHGDTLALLRRNFNWAMITLLPIGLVAATVNAHADPGFQGTLGRITLVLLLLGFTWLNARLIHPRTGALKHILAEHPQGWGNRLSGLWYPGLLAVPLGLAVLPLLGYHYTAGVLLQSLVQELWLVLGLIVAHQSIVRWLIVARRSLALQAAMERRAQREAQKEELAAGGEAPAAPEEQVDLATLDEQTRRLINTMVVIAGLFGLWLIWSGVLPALHVFENVELWHYETTVDAVVQQVPVTLADIGQLLVIIIIATAAAKNLPALLEILLLRNTEITAGSRYTITTLTGYAIVAIAALLAFSTLGLSWGQVQWLVAALGVGIGFGLQEIVANFISGLILLFERPLRVGDIVTVGDTTGSVSKIEIRATTIRNWDKQELLVPNKELITGRLTNWTLTDQLNRIVIPVGVEYGSDTRKALAILRAVAEEHPKILDDPAPLITFEGFGDNALTLVLRCYLDSLEFRLAVTTELHQAIDDKLRAAGIGIAFPQRDIHLHAGEPLDIRLHRPSRAPTDVPPAAGDEPGTST
jgi:potassium efflux system protein